MRNQLGESGRAIWDAYEAGKLDAGQRALVLEYARSADTADQLAGLAAGRRESWATLVFDDMGEIHLSIDKILDRVVKNQTTLKALHSELRMAGIKPKQVSATEAEEEEPEDALAKRRKEKERREYQLG